MRKTVRYQELDERGNIHTGILSDLQYEFIDGEWAVSGGERHFTWHAKGKTSVTATLNWLRHRLGCEDVKEDYYATIKPVQRINPAGQAEARDRIKIMQTVIFKELRLTDGKSDPMVAATILRAGLLEIDGMLAALHMALKENSETAAEAPLNEPEKG